MRKIVDSLTQDLFASIPKEYPQTQGAWRFRLEISSAMSDAIGASEKDIYQIAADMSRMLGREVSINTLRKYSSPAAEDHVPNLETAMAFDAATGRMALISIYAEKLGCSVLPGKDKLLAELGRIEQQKSDLSKQERAIKQFLEKSR